MLPIQFIRENPERVQEGALNKGEKLDVQRILSLDRDIRTKLHEVEELKARRNKASQEISGLKKQKLDATDIIVEMKDISATIKNLDTEIADLRKPLNELMIWVPNIPHESVPLGKDENDNVEIRSWGTPPEFDFKPKGHLTLGKSLGLFNFEWGSKLSGTGFPLYTGNGAKLERALINFMLDYHINNNYEELYPPFVTLRHTLEATGQLPKLEEDMYHIDDGEMFLIPTAEVPVTNIYRDDILSEEELPQKYVAFSPCFRREAGSYGKETRGLIRVHQFNKVELVKFVLPESSYDELESLILDAESIVQALGLHYRVMELCTGELSFASTKCYDIEVWAPGENRWLEVSSCSNFEAFQARRANIRYRKENGGVNFIHTLNGSGVATARLMVALLETYQNNDGTVNIPDVLQPYMQMTLLGN